MTDTLIMKMDHKKHFLCTDLALPMAVCFILSGIAIAEMNYSDYAVEVVEYAGPFGASPHDDPSSLLGKPATDFKDLSDMSGGTISRRVKLVEAPYNVDAEGNKIITTIKPGAYIVVKFDHKVVDYPGNLYGVDFIVFGNPNLAGSGYVNDSTNLNTYLLNGSGAFESVRVSVSQDGEIWHSYNAGPWADDLFPTQAYVWDRQNAQWTDVEMDFTRPVDPNLSYGDFAGISAADAIDLYDGSGGGTPFDLQNLVDYNDLSVDPDSGYRWIQYIRFDDVDSPQGAEIDAVSDVAACGDPTHPYPVGDINLDCRVNLEDYVILGGFWLHTITIPQDPAVIADIYTDHVVGLEDLRLVVENWLLCTYQCDEVPL